MPQSPICPRSQYVHRTLGQCILSRAPPPPAMQEPHLQMGSAQLESRSSSLTDLAKQHGYGCRAQLPPPPTPGGGGALFWRKDWTEVASASISPRLLLTNLLSPEGLVYTVVSAHFSDKPDKWKSQWLRLKEAMAVFPFSQHILLLADHNSVITPGDDSEHISEHDNLPPPPRSQGTG